MTFTVEIPRNYRERWEWDAPDPDGTWRVVTLAEVLTMPLKPRERFKVVRDRSERTQLPRWQRIAVLKRDEFVCKACGAQGGRLEVDHIIPWSAGGPDASWNLRTLCHDCNQHRSNYNTGWKARALPIVSDCRECSWRGEGYEPDVTVWCDRCQELSSARFSEIEAAPFQRIDSLSLARGAA